MVKWERQNCVSLVPKVGEEQHCGQSLALKSCTEVLKGKKIFDLEHAKQCIEVLFKQNTELLDI